MPFFKFLPILGLIFALESTVGDPVPSNDSTTATPIFDFNLNSLIAPFKNTAKYAIVTAYYRVETICRMFKTLTQQAFVSMNDGSNLTLSQVMNSTMNYEITENSSS